MAAKKKAAAAPAKQAEAAATAEPEREPDRVAMLSIRADGTPDQYKPILLDDEA